MQYIGGPSDWQPDKLLLAGIVIYHNFCY